MSEANPCAPGAAGPVRPIRRLAMVHHPGKTAARRLADELAAAAQAAGVAVRASTDFPLRRGFLEDGDACCVIGGDGTLLGVVEEAARAQVPVIGVNQGSLGFLTNFSPEEARLQFGDLMQGRFRVAPRSLLQCSIGGVPCGLALNDVVLKERGNVRMLRLGVRAGGEAVTEYHCDGLIVASPTGSTAYNLSAGGPIVHPAADVVTVTPICPHTLSNRAVILPAGTEMEVACRSRGVRVVVAVDGVRRGVVRGGETVSVCRAGCCLLLAQKVGYSHFEVVRAKLGWTGAHVATRP